jgi:GNAT superfamily N-acetyltransferase
MADNLTVRNVLPVDHDAWLPLWHGYQRFYNEEIPAEVTRITWARLLDPTEPVFGALALAGDRAVGMVHWLYHRSCWSVANNCYLQDLFVVPDHRGSGVGRNLIEHVAAAARDAACAKVYWLTHETNATAMRLYDRIAHRTGFVHYERKLP